MPTPKLLLIVHQFYNRAGIEEHVKALAVTLKDSFEIHTVFPHQGALRVVHEGKETLALPAPPVHLLAPYQVPDVERALLQIFERVKPDLFHVVHSVFWPLSLYDLCLKTEKPLVTSFHDYYALTPYWTMQGESDTSILTSKEHALKIFKKDISPYLLERRKVFERAMKSAQKRVVASHFIKDTLQTIFPDEFDVIPYGILPYELPSKQPEVPPGKTLRFGYLGTLIPQKGAESLLKAFIHVRKRFPEISLEIFGGKNPLPNEIPGVTFHGPYETENLGSIMPQFDVGIIPSIFAETFSIVLSELWYAKKPVAASNIGALGERIQDLKNGRLFEAGNPREIAEVLEWFITNEEWREWEAPNPPLAEEMGAMYEELYLSVIPTNERS